jgi:hypothetical protein
MIIRDADCVAAAAAATNVLLHDMAGWSAAAGIRGRDSASPDGKRKRPHHVKARSETSAVRLVP